jgi:hypothetical protein
MAVTPWTPPPPPWAQGNPSPPRPDPRSDPSYYSGPGRDPRFWRRRWTWDETLAARWAAPWWTLAWLLTLGRFGRALWTWEPRECRHGVSMLDKCAACRGVPPQGGSGVPLPPHLHEGR